MRKVFSCILFMLWLSITGVYAEDIPLDFDINTDFSKYKTYSFVEDTDVSQNGLLADSHVRKRLEEIISDQLKSKGLQKVSHNQKPDLTVRYWIAMNENKSENEKQNLIELSGENSYWNAVWVMACTDLTIEGPQSVILVVDLMDTGKKELVWRTRLREALKNEDKDLKQIHKELERAFKHYPPFEEDKEKGRLSYD